MRSGTVFIVAQSGQHAAAGATQGPLSQAFLVLRGGLSRPMLAENSDRRRDGDTVALPGQPTATASGLLISVWAVPMLLSQAQAAKSPPVQIMLASGRAFVSNGHSCLQEGVCLEGSDAQLGVGPRKKRGGTPWIGPKMSLCCFKRTNITSAHGWAMGQRPCLVAAVCELPLPAGRHHRPLLPPCRCRCPPSPCLLRHAPC